MWDRRVVVVALGLLGCSPFTSKSSTPPPPDAGQAPVATIGGEPPVTTPTPAAGGDRDGDGVADAVDRCPDAAEVVNGYEDGDGCPDVAVAQPEPTPGGGASSPPPATEAPLGPLGAVAFDASSAAISAGGKAQVDRVVAALRGKDTARLAIVGHTTASESRKLGLERAEAVRDALVAAGIDGARLEVRNVGADQPQGDEARDRRVEFTQL